MHALYSFSSGLKAATQLQCGYAGWFASHPRKLSLYHGQNTATQLNVYKIAYYNEIQFFFFLRDAVLSSQVHEHLSRSSSSVFFPKAGPSLQAQEPRLQFCRRQVFHRKLGNQGCSFTWNWVGAAASRCFPHEHLLKTKIVNVRNLLLSIRTLLYRLKSYKK